MVKLSMKEERFCANTECNLPLTRRSQKVYCGSACAGDYKRITLIQSWLSGKWDGSHKNGSLSNTVRNHLLKEADYKCSDCGWNKINLSTGCSPLEIDHIDGNSENNTHSNLRVLYPNCHSLTPTYKGLNVIGRGTRAYRKKYNQFDLVGLNHQDQTKTTCKCGAPKHRNANQCKACNNEKIQEKLKSVYPPNEVMVAEIKRISLTEYAPILDRTPKAIKAYLKKRGYTNDDLRIEREVKVVHCSTCAVQLTLEEVKMDRKRCAEHTVVSANYPPVEEIIAGVKELGYNGYARSIGLKYGSSVRKYLKKRNVVIDKD
jgi:hypothetical protein